MREPSAKNFNQNINTFFLSVYALTFLGLLVSFATAYLLKPYYLKLFKFHHANFIIMGIYLVCFFFLFHRIENLLYATNIDLKYSLGIFILISLMEGFLLTPILNFVNPEILKLALIITTGLFVFFSIIGFFIMYDLSGIAKTALLTLMAFLAYEIISILFNLNSILNILAISFVVLACMLAILTCTVQKLKNLYYTHSINQDNLIVYGAILLHQKFISILMQVIRILMILTKKNNNKD